MQKADQLIDGLEAENEDFLCVAEAAGDALKEDPSPSDLSRHQLHEFEEFLKLHDPFEKWKSQLVRVALNSGDVLWVSQEGKEKLDEEGSLGAEPPPPTPSARSTAELQHLRSARAQQAAAAVSHEAMPALAVAAAPALSPQVAQAAGAVTNAQAPVSPAAVSLDIAAEQTPLQPAPASAVAGGLHPAHPHPLAALPNPGKRLSPSRQSAHGFTARSHERHVAGGWQCQVCRSTHTRPGKRFRCAACSFDMCEVCWERKAQPAPVPQFIAAATVAAPAEREKEKVDLCCCSFYV